MRTTIRLDERLLREAKVKAAEEGRTLTSLIEDGLRSELARRSRARQTPFQLITFGGDGLAVGVRQEDLKDNSRTLDLLEELD